MQTDPNWTNFLWDDKIRSVGLVDFGATRQYDRQFIDGWLQLLRAAIASNEEACVHWSKQLGYLTGEENEVRSTRHIFHW